MEKQYNAILSVFLNVPRWVPLKVFVVLCLDNNKQAVGFNYTKQFRCVVSSAILKLKFTEKRFQTMKTKTSDTFLPFLGMLINNQV